MTKGHNRYCGLVRGPHVGKIDLNYFEMFVVYTQFTNMAAGRIIEYGGRRIGDPWYNVRQLELLNLIYIA